MESEIVLYDDPRITVRVPISELDKKQDSIKAEPLSNLERTDLLFNKTPPSFSSMKSISDIYWITGDFNFMVPCRVSLQIKRNYNEEMNDLKAVVRDSGKWTEIPASLENEFAVFELRKMDCVCIVIVLKETETDMTEQDDENSFDAVEVHCVMEPEKAETMPTVKTIKVLLLDDEGAKKVQQSREKDWTKLKPAVTVALPLNLPPNSQDYETILLTLDEVGDNSVVSSDFPSPKNQLFALVKKTANVKLLHDEVLLHLGLTRYYKVLTFRHPKQVTALFIECTPMNKVQQVIDERKKEGYVLERFGGQSNPLLLRQEQRLKMDITGNIVKDVTVPEVAYFITVLFCAQELKTIIPYKIKGVLGGTHLGNLTISSDNFKREVLWSMNFDPKFVIGNYPYPYQSSWTHTPCSGP